MQVEVAVQAHLAMQVELAVQVQLAAGPRGRAQQAAPSAG
jgi:hypothetical protein